MNRIQLKFLFMLVLLPLLSCNKVENENVLSEETMKNILIDLHLAESIAGKKGGLQVHREILRFDLIEDILEKYQIDKETFFQSYQYYMERPIRMDSIYVQILEVFEEKSEDDYADKYADSEEPIDSTKTKKIPASQSAKEE